MRAGGLQSHLKDDAWGRFAQAGLAKSYRRGAMLIRQGDRSTHVYVLLGGIVKVIREEACGSGVILNLRTVGDIVGDMAAVDGHPRVATVLALTTVTTRMVFADEFDLLAKDHRKELNAYANQRLRESAERRTEQAALSVSQRLARALLRLAQPIGDDRAVVALGLPQGELAQFVGASRNSVVNLLCRWRAEGILSTGHRQIAIASLSRLRSYAAM